MRRAAFAALLILGAFATVAAGLAVWLYGSFQRPNPDAKAATIIVPRGAGVDDIAQLLADNGVIEDKIVFALGVRLTESGGRLRPRAESTGGRLASDRGDGGLHRPVHDIARTP